MGYFYEKTIVESILTRKIYLFLQNTIVLYKVISVPHR